MNQKFNRKWLIYFIGAFFALSRPAFADQRLGFHPSVGVTEFYDSNLFLSQANEEGDFITVVTPMVQSFFLLRSGDLHLNYTLNANLPINYFDDPRLELFTHDGELKFLSHLTGRMDLEIYDGIKTVSNDLTKPDYQLSNVLHVNNVGAELRYNLPFSARTAASLELAGERSLVIDFPSDRYTYKARLNITRELTPRFLGGLRTGVARIDFDSPTLQDVMIYLGELRAEYQLTDNLLLRTPVGVQYLQLENADGNLTGSFDVALEGHVSSRSEIKLTYKQGFSVDVRGNSFDRWETAVVLNHEINPRAKLEIGASYFNFFLETVTAEDDGLIEGNTRLNYELLDNFSANFGGRVFLNRGANDGDDLDLWQMFLGLKYEFFKK